MLRFGSAEYLECSSKGDKRFSAFYARIRRRGNKSIEELYQARKMFEDGTSGLSIKEAKGKKPINIEDCRAFYSLLWQEFFQENYCLLEELNQYNGFSDIFGQRDHACQSEEIFKNVMEYRICRDTKEDT